MAPDKKYTPFKTPFGFEIPLTPLAVWLMGLVVVAAMAGWLYQKLYDDPERKILTLEEAQKRMNAEVEEYGLHVMENPEKHEVFEDSDGKLMLRVYKDHCVMIQRQTRSGVKTKLVIDLARPTPIVQQVSNLTWPELPDVLPVARAAGGDPCKRGCLNPHPGQFQWKYGRQHPGGWVEVWRRWDEGCEHYQMFHPASQTWDSNQDGTPRVTWVCCVH